MILVNDHTPMGMILDITSVPVYIQDYRAAYKTGLTIEQITSFENRFTGIKEQKLSTNEKIKYLKELVQEFEELFDKDIFILHMGRILKADYERAEHAKFLNETRLLGQRVYSETNQVDRMITHKKSAVSKIKNLLKGADVIDLAILPPLSTKEQPSGKTTSLEFIGIERKHEQRITEASKRLLKIESSVGLSEILDYLSPRDLISICRYENLAFLLMSELFDNVQEAEEQDDLEETGTNGEKYNKKQFEDEIRKNFQYIEIDTMLVLACYRYCKMYEISQEEITQNESDELQESQEEITQNEIDELQEFLRCVEKLLYKKDAKFKMKSINKEVDFQDLQRQVENLQKHFVGGKFRNDTELASMAQNIISGTFPISDLNSSEFMNFGFSQEEISTIIRNNPNALNYLISNKIISKSEIESYVAFQEVFSNEMLMNLIALGHINSEQILKFYIQGKITLDNIRYVKLKADKDVLEKSGMICQDENGNIRDDAIISPQKFVDLYLEPEKTTEFERYRTLYKLLVMDETRQEIDEKHEAIGDSIKEKEIEDKIIQRQSIAGEQLLEELLLRDQLTEDVIFDWYYTGILNLEKFFEHGIGFKLDEEMSENAIESIIKIFATGKLKPKDARILYDKNVLTDEMLTRVFQDISIPKIQRITLLRSTFTKKEDINIRNAFMEEMENFSQSSKKRKKSLNDANYQEQETEQDEDTAEEETEEKSSKDSKNNIDPFDRWEKLEKRDKDYSEILLDDGTLIIYLPNKGKYIVEKLFNKDNSPATGAATYFLTESAFKKYYKTFINYNDKLNEDVFENEPTSKIALVDIKQSCTIDRYSLVKLWKDGVEGVSREVHKSWEKALDRQLGNEEEETIPEERRKNVEVLVGQVVPARSFEEPSV